MKSVIARNEAISKLCISNMRNGDCFVPRNDARVLGLITFFLLFALNSFAQTPYENNVFNPAIKSVEFYNTAKQASFPIINLGSKEQVLLAFDDLRGSSRNFYYTIEHCDENWNSSNISSNEYLQGYTDDRILDYTYSSGTIQKYTHYEVKLPNDNIAPKISGNYVLKVYEDADQSKMVLTRRLFVVGTKLSLSADIVPSGSLSTRQTNQKVNFQIQYGNLQVQNPSNDLKVFIVQNARWETGLWTTQPAYIHGAQLIYNDLNSNDFPGRYEFRHFDTRTLKLNSDRVARIFRDTGYTVLLLGDPDRNAPGYSFQYDNDGNFFILNQDGSDPKRDADYTHVYFSLAANKTPNDGSAYIVGKFNDYRLDNRSKMAYEPIKGRFMANLLLKQGVYDYQYVWVDNNTGKPDDILLEGNHFETENDYQVLVYFHPANARWAELVSYRLLNTTKK
ncbi:MAG: type IX secretion system plug protein [Mucilaginibacter sp.]